MDHLQLLATTQGQQLLQFRQCSGLKPLIETGSRRGLCSADGAFLKIHQQQRCGERRLLHGNGGESHNHGQRIAQLLCLNRPLIPLISGSAVWRSPG